MNEFTFADIFSLSMSPLQVIVTLLMALVVGGFICFVYKKTFGGVMYSRNFNLSLIVLTMVTALMLMLINNSLALSLGMVGALSIIRFRTAIKDPMDTVFMFWSIVIGIITGAGYITVAILAALLLGALFLALNLLSGKLHTNSYLVVMRYTPEGESAVRSTHDFLREEDFRYYKEQVPAYFPQVTLVGFEQDARLTGFIGTADGNIEMLFVENASRGQGIGRQLVRHAIEVLQATRVDVNEANTAALGFYERMGFRVVSRSERDGEGKPYPLLHMQLG